MADNVGYTPGSGATVAADDIGGILYQRVKPVTGDDGTATDVSATNPMPVAAYGELMETLQSIRMFLRSLQAGLGQVYSDGVGRMRVNLEAGTLATVSTVSTVTTISASTLTSYSPALSNTGNTSQVLPSLSAISVGDLRSNIVVS